MVNRLNKECFHAGYFDTCRTSSFLQEGKRIFEVSFFKSTWDRYRLCCFFSEVVCLLSSNRKDKYDAIKKYLCTDCPTPSQCVLARTLGKPQTVMAIATKIALQMNCKMGGELWSVEIPVSSLVVFFPPS